ncbi:MAG: cobalamin-dependent protein [Arenicellales bacterium]|nr:cobalamin-dependent protein [Arenicellales bacterium]
MRKRVLTEKQIPDLTDLIGEARGTAKHIRVGRCSFLQSHEVSSEFEYKNKKVLSGNIMRHAQIGYRSLERSCQAYREIYARLHDQNCSLDRYGVCLDWSMGYPPNERTARPRGTGLILDSSEAYVRLTSQAPVAPHFGDFVMGMPAAFDNTCAALSAGATSIGNLGQYFTFRLPHWHDDIVITVQTVKAIALCAAQPVPILIHSNLDDGFGALFTDLACTLGAVLLEQYIVNDLLGGTVSHCYGHTYSDPLARFAFQRALAEVSQAPGTMVYGNTTLYGKGIAPNFAGLGSYLLVDVLAQMFKPSGHAINPVPVSEAHRIPDIEEIVDAHLFADRLINRAEGFKTLISLEKVDITATNIIEGASRFKDRVIDGFSTGGIDVQNPVEMLLAMRRLGARFLEQEFGPGEKETISPSGRKAVFLAATISELEQQADACVNALSEEQKQSLSDSGFKICVATTDVHEYGKLLVESVLAKVGISSIDGGVCTDPEDLVKRIVSEKANVIAISTYNGVALHYLDRLNSELDKNNLEGTPIYIGGKLNQIIETDAFAHDDLPVDVTQQLSAAGAIPCLQLEDMLLDLLTKNL